MENTDNLNNKILIQILKGVGIAFIVSIIFLLILAIILTYSNVSEAIINPSIIIITSLSILIGSTISNIKIKRKGLVNGGIIGGIYIILLYLFSSIFSMQFLLNLQSIIMIIIGIAFGILGGVIGVNISSK